MRNVPHLSAAFSGEGIDPLFVNTSDNCGALRKSRALLSECANSELTDGRHMGFRIVPYLQAAFSEADRNAHLETHQITAATLGKLRRPISERVDLAPPDGRRLEFRAVPHL